MTDDFNRADATPLDGGWTTINAETQLVLAANVAVPNVFANDCGAFKTGRTWADDQSSSALITCTGTAGSGAGIGLAVRVASGARTYYRFVVDHAGASNAHLRRAVAGSFSVLADWTQTFTDGDRFTFRVTGPASAAFLEVLRNGASVQTFTDNSSLTSGSPGLSYSSTETAATWDDWEGGEFTADPAVTPPIAWITV